MSKLPWMIYDSPVMSHLWLCDRELFKSSFRIRFQYMFQCHSKFVLGRVSSEYNISAHKGLIIPHCIGGSSNWLHLFLYLTALLQYGKPFMLYLFSALLCAIELLLVGIKVENFTIQFVQFQLESSLIQFYLVTIPIRKSPLTCIHFWFAELSNWICTKNGIAQLCNHNCY